MSKKPADAQVIGEEEQLSTYLKQCVQDSWVVGLNSVETVLKKIDDDITFKEVDKKRKPYAVMNTLSLCFKDSIASVINADPRGDDRFLVIEESCDEPIAAVIDNYKGVPQTKPIVKEESIQHNS
jgi:hypothetical protein